MPQTVDTSMYSTLGGGASPMDTLGKMMQIRSAANANMQFQQEYKARVAMGQVMQQSVGPDGQPDYMKAATLAAQNPDAGWLAPDLMSKAVTMQGVSLDNVLKKFTLVKTQRELEGQAASGLLQKGDAVTHDDAVGAISDLYGKYLANGINDPKVLDGLIQTLGTIPTGGSAIAEWARQHSQYAATAADGLNRVQDELQTYEQGGQTWVGHYNKQTQKLTPIGTLSKTPTPAEVNAPTELAGPNGEKTLVPRSVAAPMTGTGQNTGVFSGAPGQVAPPNVGPVMGGPQVPSAVPQAPGPPGTRGPITDIGPFRQAQLKNVADYQNGLNDQVSTINQNIQAIQKLQDLTGKVHTGMFGEERLEGARFLKAMGLPATVTDKLANGSLEGSQELMKYSVPNAMNTLRNSLGNQSRITNMEFGAFQRANPNLETDPEAMHKILDFTHQLMRLKQQEQAAYGKWTSSGRDPVGFQQAWTGELIKRGYVRSEDSYSPYKEPK